ncbi:MAG: M14 family zinc carboxypeptidase [Gemmatimonadota bacterium]|nr:M14 family zinc carboxypeptidase [Gemmatimonadota bacterium]
MLKAIALAALIQVPAPSQELAPGTRYDASIPTLEQVAGHGLREEITPPDQVIAYLEALAASAPERTELMRTGETWEGRATVMLVIGSPERMARLQALKADLRRLADPSALGGDDAERLVAELPVVTAFVHGVHGNEISSSGAAMAEAYHLLAARGDATVDLILRESLVLIDPMQNPDGRARFVFQNTMGRARWEDAAAASAEHDEPWPGGRVNHYLFDLNRDWFAQTQPETRGRVAALLEFMPHVVVDLHEMGGNSTYFFPPNAIPGNTWTTDEQRELTDVFGAANAAKFDERGFAYFNRDTYDAFYPGYGVSWPMAQGAIGATYEQASARGLVLLRSDGDQLTYGDGVLHHFTAAIQTAATAATHRERILRTYLDFRTSAVEMGRSGPREYVLTSEHDPGMARRLADALVRSGIRVDKALEAVEVGDRTLPAEGTYIVPMDQPTHRLIRNLLDPHTPMDADFVARQIERRANRMPDQIYDVTAWSMPLLWDVELIMAERPTGAATVSLNDTRQMSDVASLRDATVGYLMPWGTAAAAAVAEALREGIRVRSAGGEFTLSDREYAVGTAIVRNSDNGPDLAQRLARIATRHGAEVVPIDDSYVREGMSLGSGRVRHLTEPRVLLVYDQPGQTYSVGWARYVLEQRYGQRTTAVRASSLGRVDLSDFDVIVFPSGNYGDVVGDGMQDALSGWMRSGGTMITMSESTRWAARAGLLATNAERRGGRAEGDDPPTSESADQPIDFLQAIAPSDEAPEQTPGAIVRGTLDTGHWLASGTDGEIGVLVEGTRIFAPITLDRGTNVGRYAGVDNLVMGGIVWEDAKPQLANKPFLFHQPMGRGQLIAFAEDPNYRAYAEATQLLFINAVLLGPGR